MLGLAYVYMQEASTPNTTITHMHSVHTKTVTEVSKCVQNLNYQSVNVWSVARCSQAKQQDKLWHTQFIASLSFSPLMTGRELPLRYFSVSMAAFKVSIDSRSGLAPNGYMSTNGTFIVTFDKILESVLLKQAAWLKWIGYRLCMCWHGIETMFDTSQIHCILCLLKCFKVGKCYMLSV